MVYEGHLVVHFLLKHISVKMNDEFVKSSLTKWTFTLCCVLTYGIEDYTEFHGCIIICDRLVCIHFIII